MHGWTDELNKHP